MAESWIQVAVDGTGKRVRNILLAAFGGGPDVYQQVVGLAKSDGTLIDDPSRSSVAQPVTHAALDIALSALRDAITGAKTQADIVAALGAVVVASGSVSVSNLPADQLVHAANLDVALSTRLKPGDTVLVDASAYGGQQMLDMLRTISQQIQTTNLLLTMIFPSVANFPIPIAAMAGD